MMMWPFKKRKPLVIPFGSFIAALKRKDRDLYEELKRLHPISFWQQWKRVHPEDFPQGGMTLVGPGAIVE